MISKAVLVLASVATLTLPGCGGGSGSATGQSASAPQPQVPDTPTAPTPAPSAPTTGTNILFIGGSVTRGSSSSSYATSYSQLVTARLKAKFGTAQDYNIAVGATNSEFGAYRLDRDIGTFKPDVAVIEFAINDLPGDKAQLVASTDAIIYKLRQVNPRVRVVYAALTSTDEQAAREAGSRDPRKDWAQAVVEGNGGTFIDAGASIWTDVLAGRARAADSFADRLHANDRGHAAYADAIAPVLEGLISAGPPPAASTSTYISRSALDTSRMVERDQLLQATSCTRTSSDRRDAWQQTKSYFAQALSCEAGQAFEVRFTGTSIGFIQMLQPTSGAISCVVDGSRNVTIARPAVENVFVHMVARYLANGSHTMRCESSGTLYVGEFLVSQAQPLSL